MFSLYRLLTDLSAWPLRALLTLRSWQGKEEPLRLNERRGITEAVRPQGLLVWCHAASVGEAITFLPVIGRIREDAKASVLLTTGTVSSARLMSERLPSPVIHQFAPWDHRAWIARFLDRWQPDMAIRMESELWPNTLSAIRDGDVPVVVINGRLSEKSARGWRRVPSFAKQVFGCLTQVVAQSDEYANRFAELGARQVEIGGNLKLAAPALPVDQQTKAKFERMIGARPVWLAASTHPGEEDIALEVHRYVAQDMPDLLTIVAPRHAHRGAAIAQTVEQHGLSFIRRSSDTPITSSTDVVVADTFGELGLWFSLSPIAFMGKSLEVGGGQNPIEPTHFDCATLFGPHMENFKDIAEIMLSEDMARQVTDARDLASQIEHLLRHPEERASLAAKGHKLLDSGRESLDKTATVLMRILDNTARAKHESNRGTNGT